MQLQGTIKQIGQTQSGEGKNGKEWQKREFVIDYKDGNYEKMAPFTVMGDKVSALDSFKQGDSVSVSFNIEGREYNNKFYANLVAWKIEKK